MCTPFVQYGSVSFDKHSQLYGYYNIQSRFITAQIPLSLYIHPFLASRQRLTHFIIC